MSNTRTMLGLYDLKDLLEGYKRAYLRKKQLDRRHRNSARYRHWDLGTFEEGNLIRAADNSLFSFVTCPVITDNDAAKTRQTVSANLQEVFLSIIAYLMAKQHQQLPSQKIKIAFGINHLNSHWTCLLAEFEGIDAERYQELFEAHAIYAALSENQAQYFKKDGSPRPFNIQVNNIKNYLIANCGLILKGADLGNWQLPLQTRQILLRHLDSIRTKTSYAENVKNSAEGFMRRHRGTKFRYEKCSRQAGNTCGDWTIFNAFTRGVLNERKEVSSEDLRALSENITTQNVRNILYTSKPKITRANARNKICVTKAEREIVKHQDYLDEVAESVTTIGKIKKLSPKWDRTSRILCALILAAICYISLPWLMPMSFLVQCGVSVLAASVGMMSLNKFAYSIYGQYKLKIQLDKKVRPVKAAYEESEGFASWFGFSLPPYLKTLSELEQDIATLLQSYDAQKPKSKHSFAENIEKCQILVHYYAKKIITENPSDFYDEDRNIVANEKYVDEKQARKLIKKGCF